MVVAKLATTTKHGAIEGKKQTHDVSFYNLYMIFSVGYRVKSQRGIDFRKWTNMVLKNYVLHGYAINNRLDRLEVKVFRLEEKRLKLRQKSTEEATSKDFLLVQNEGGRNIKRREQFAFFANSFFRQAFSSL